MGIFRPGAPGTQVHVYDDNDATGGHAAGSPHTWAEINAAYPVEFAIMQDAAANVFSATHRQYLCTADLMLGHPVGGNTNLTSLVDATGADIFSPAGGGAQSRLRCTTANNFNLQTLTLGTKIGTGSKMTGKNGGTIHAGNNTLALRCNLNLYGCFIDCGAAFSIQNTTGNSVEIAGCTIQVTSGGLVLGVVSNPFTIYNTTINSQTALDFCSSCVLSDASGLMWAATAPNRFYASATPLRRFEGIRLSGAVNIADFRFMIGNGVNYGFDVEYSDTPGKPRMTTQVTSLDVLRDYRTFDVKVVGDDGQALAGVPIYLESDVDGPVLSAATTTDGNVVFTDASTGANQVILVRAYGDASGGDTSATTVATDRLFTLWVNSYKDAGTFPPVLNRETRKFQFEWPGRDRFGSGYQTDGGSFQKTMDVISLANGIPSAGTLWVERVAP